MPRRGWLAARLALFLAGAPVATAIIGHWAYRAGAARACAGRDGPG
jgi:hypothetical protein